MGKLGLFYGTTSGFTQVVAEQIKNNLGAELSVFQDINKSKPDDLLACDRLILGIPTWDDGQLQTDWWAFFDKLDKMDFTGKTVAIFGLGDQNGYPDTFLDAVGTLGNKIIERGGMLVGYWPTDGYSFSKSTAIKDGKFMGLAIDTVGQDELTHERVDKWVAQIKSEFSAAVATD